jgi:hypothetical protein
VTNAESAKNDSDTSNEVRGDVLTVLRMLLSDGRDADVEALVSKLLARNSELECRLAQLLSRRHKNEGVSSAQLLLFLSELDRSKTEQQPDGASTRDLTDANDKLRVASGIDDQVPDEERETTPKRQPQLRKPIPPAISRCQIVEFMARKLSCAGVIPYRWGHVDGPDLQEVRA